MINDELRGTVRGMVEDMHRLFTKGHTPKVKWEKSCNACSLKEICLPRMGKLSSVGTYIEKKLQEESV